MKLKMTREREREKEGKARKYKTDHIPKHTLYVYCKKRKKEIRERNMKIRRYIRRREETTERSARKEKKRERQRNVPTVCIQA